MKTNLCSRGRSRLLLVFGVLALLAFALPVQAQQYAINWYKVSGGGAMNTTGGVYSVSGTIGQHDAGGPMTGGNYSLTGGFWALYALQTPGAPFLTIFLTHTNTAIVAWPAPSTDWYLYENNNLRTTNWVAVTNPVPIVVNGSNQVTIAPLVGDLFFRLKHQ